jgi:hypothetical protein
MSQNPRFKVIIGQTLAESHIFLDDKDISSLINGVEIRAITPGIPTLVIMVSPFNFEAAFDMLVDRLTLVVRDHDTDLNHTEPELSIPCDS